ncbi:MAG: Flp pilus assembly protein CpaB [Bryobacterales bacterium]|nr:Flp pilus assembly protein CpaB [Bryobacterales bacterium]
MSAKKKSLVPLFGVAFIVAILSTGIFYGLFVGKLNSATATPPAQAHVLVAAEAVAGGAVLKADQLKRVPWSLPALPAGAFSKVEEAAGQVVVDSLEANELVTRAKLASKGGGPVDGGSMGIPDGMRAVSITVQDSAGVMAMLRPGHRIDIHVVGHVQTSSGNEPQLRTLLENMRVLTVPRDSQMGRGAGQVITMLATPKEASMLGLADSTAKIRIALRNPVDSKTERSAAAGLGNVVQRAAGAAAGTPAVQQQRPVKHVEFLVQVASAGDEAVAQLEAQLRERGKGGMLDVAAFRPGEELQRSVAKLRAQKTLDVVSSSQVQSGLRTEAGTQWALDAERSGAALRIRFAPSTQSDGRMRLKVSPQVTTPGADGLRTRSVETEIEIADGQSFLVRGLAEAGSTAALWEKLFPEKQAEGKREMVVLVTPKLIRN